MSKIINVNFDAKSIKEAIERIKNVQNKMKNEIPSAYLKKCLNYIKNEANKNLEVSGIGSEVIQAIQNGWNEPEPVGNVAILTNNCYKAYLVEFGVGIVGAGKGYPQDFSPSDYKYDEDSDYKKDDRSWNFNLSDDSKLNIKIENVNKNTNKKSGKEYYNTQGQEAILYVYNAIMSFKDTGAYKQLWQQTLKELL